MVKHLKKRVFLSKNVNQLTFSKNLKSSIDYLYSMLYTLFEPSGFMSPRSLIPLVNQLFFAMAGDPVAPNALSPDQACAYRIFRAG